MGGGVAFAEYYDDNSGDSWEDAYIIDSAEDFELMLNRAYNYESGKYYKIGADFEVNRNGYSSTPNSFYSYLDGQNHTITIDITNGLYSSAALFWIVSVSNDEVAIKNLNIKGNVKSEISDSGSSAAALALALNSGIIENCNVDANVEATDSAGGIVFSNSGIIRNCTFSGNVSATSSTTTTAGGIAVALINGRIENCTVSSGSTISASGGVIDGVEIGSAGGIAGQAMGILSQAAIINCTSNAALEGNANYKGGIVGITNNIGNQYTNYPGALLSGNTWPNEYPEAGDGSSTNTPSTPITNPNSITSSDNTELPPATVQPIALSAESLDQIAELLSIDEPLLILDATNITAPQEPTLTMRDYVAHDDAELIGKLNTLTVPEDGWYVFKVTLGDELWALVESEDVSRFKFYALNDSEAEVGSAFILNGLLSTWEVLTMSGQKMNKFGAREFLMVGFLNSGKSLCLFIAKTILALLTGGLGACTAGYTGAIGAAVIILFTLRRKR